MLFIIILQPILENSVIHGLAPKGSGNIQVSGYIINSGIVFEILDDGVGIAPDQLNEIKADLESDNIFRGRHVGMANVHYRLQAMFGTEYGISLESTINSYTKAIINLPLLQPDN